MILRKPYAFLIKNFRLIHGIVFVMSLYILYQTGVILAFLNRYSDVSSVVGQNLVSSNFSMLLFLVPILIIIISTILLWVLAVKKKPYVIYIYNIILFIFCLIVLSISKDTVKLMEEQLIDIRGVRAIRDLLMILVVFEGVEVIFMLVRFTGFDIKKFNFGKDIKELEIAAEDSEEFEVAVSFKPNVISRRFNNKIRNLKYFYVEHQFVINCSFGIIFIVIAIVGSINIFTKEKIYSEGTVLTKNGISLRINNAYTTINNYRNKVLVNENMKLLVVDASLKTGISNGAVFKTANIPISIGEWNFYPVDKYNEGLFDLGRVYNDSVILNEWERFIFVYEIPKNYFNSKIYLKYYDIYESDEYSTIALAPVDLDGEVIKKTITLGDQLDLSDSILNNIDFSIASFEVNNLFKSEYNFCVTKNECYKSHEYLRAGYSGNYDKALLKVKGEFNDENDYFKDKINSLYDFINYFGTYQYTIGEQVFFNKIPLAQVKTNKAVENGVYYIEVEEEMLDAVAIKLIMRIRNCQYEYVLK